MAKEVSAQTHRRSPWRTPARLLTVVAFIDATLMILALAYLLLQTSDVWPLVGTLVLMYLLAVGALRVGFAPIDEHESWDETGDKQRIIFASAFMLGAHYFSDPIVHAQNIGTALEMLSARFAGSLQTFDRSVAGQALEGLHFYFWTGDFTNKGLWIVVGLIGAALVAGFATQRRRKIGLTIAITLGVTATYLLIAQWSSLVVMGQPVDAVEHWLPP